MNRLTSGIDSLAGMLDSSELLEINENEIIFDPHQARKNIDQSALKELAESIKEHGIIQPIVVRPANEDGNYVLLAGERRVRAARLVGLAAIPAVIRDVPDAVARAISLIENLQREDLNPIDEAHGIKSLLDECGMKKGEVAKTLGKSASFISKSLGLLKGSDDAQSLISDGHTADLQAVNSIITLEKTEPAKAKKLIKDVKEGKTINLRSVAAGETAKAKDTKKEAEKKPAGKTSKKNAAETSKKEAGKKSKGDPAAYEPTRGKDKLEQLEEAAWKVSGIDAVQDARGITLIVKFNDGSADIGLKIPMKLEPALTKLLKR